MSAMPIWIKICANTSLADARLAAEAGADAVGFVFAPSPRRITPAQVAAITPHLSAGLDKIGIFVDAALDEIVSTVEQCALSGVQLHSAAGPELAARLHDRLGPQLRIVRVVHFSPEAAGQISGRIATHDRDPHVHALLIDSRTATAVGGTGVTFDWTSARTAVFQSAGARKPRIAAGGLSPANVAQAIATLRPWGVDVATGVESAPGRKDPEKVREFIANAKAAAALL